MPLYQGLGTHELEAQYNLVLRRGANEFNALVERWTVRSEHARNLLNAQLDLCYGEASREKLDYFYSGNINGPLLLYIHGGYWQRGDKSLYSFLAKNYVERGISVAILNYGLAPQTPISDIPSQIRKAIAWCWHSPKLKFARNQLHLMGHSAGGHLTAMMLATNWAQYDARLPADVIASGISISGIFDLEPLIYTSLNTALNLNPVTAQALSPCFMKVHSKAPQLVVVGGDETAEFHRQTNNYVAKLNHPAQLVTRYIVPSADHFDEITTLSNAHSELFLKTITLINNASLSL